MLTIVKMCSPSACRAARDKLSRADVEDLVGFVSFHVCVLTFNAVRIAKACCGCNGTEVLFFDGTKIRLDTSTRLWYFHSIMNNDYTLKQAWRDREAGWPWRLVKGLVLVGVYFILLPIAMGARAFSDWFDRWD